MTVDLPSLVCYNTFDFSFVGAVAQLGERYLRKVEAVGSNPIGSTTTPRWRNRQTHRSQKPARLIPHEGSSPSLGTIYPTLSGFFYSIAGSSSKYDILHAGV